MSIYDFISDAMTRDEKVVELLTVRRIETR